MTFIFRNRTIFWDISKQNRGQTKWDGGSSNFKEKKNLFSNVYLPLKELLLSPEIYFQPFDLATKLKGIFSTKKEKKKKEVNGIFSTQKKKKRGERNMR